MYDLQQAAHTLHCLAGLHSLLEGTGDGDGEGDGAGDGAGPGCGAGPGG